MRKIKIEIKWAIIFVVMILIGSGRRIF